MPERPDAPRRRNEPAPAREPTRPVSGTFVAAPPPDGGVLEAISPILWSASRRRLAGTDAAPIEAVECVTVAAKRALTWRGTVGVILEARSEDDALAQFLAIRAVSSRVPMLVIGDGVDLGKWADRFGVVTVDAALGASAVADAVERFAVHCEARARSFHRRIARFAAWRDLSPMQADLLFRLAMGVRQRHVHLAQTVAASTKKERVDDIRAKCFRMTLEAIVELALTGSRPSDASAP